MKIRTLNGSDIPLCAELLQKDQPFLRVTETRFLQKIVFEENFSPRGFFIAEENGIVLGFLNAVYRRVPYSAEVPPEQKKGWISLFCVPEEDAVPDVGAALLDAGEAYLAANGKNEISTGFFPTYFSQGVEESHTALRALFTGRGYADAQSCSLCCDLAAYREKPDIAEKREALFRGGFRIGALQTAQAPSLLRPGAPFAGGSWTYEFRSRILQGDLAAIRVCEKDGEIIGAAACHDPFSEDGRFGPFGVDPAFRGHGIGAVLLADALGEMKRRGNVFSWMQWVSEGGAAYHLYIGVGYRVWNRFHTFSKTFG